jgi:hypothetical protein
MIRRVIGLLLVVGAVASQATAEDKFTSENGRWSALFPGKPTESEKEIDTPLGKMTTYTASFDAKKGLGLLVIYVDYPDQVKKQKPQEVLARARDGAKGPFGKLLDNKVITLGESSIPGLEYQVAKAEGIFLRTRMFLDGARLYQAIIVGTKLDDLNSPGADRFLDSFELAK